MFDDPLAIVATMVVGFLPLVIFDACDVFDVDQSALSLSSPFAATITCPSTKTI